MELMAFSMVSVSALTSSPTGVAVAMVQSVSLRGVCGEGVALAKGERCMLLGEVPLLL